MTDLEILKGLGAVYDPSKDLQRLEFDGRQYVVRKQYDRYQVFEEIDGDELLLGNV